MKIPILQLLEQKGITRMTFISQLKKQQMLLNAVSRIRYCQTNADDDCAVILFEFERTFE